MMRAIRFVGVAVGLLLWSQQIFAAATTWNPSDKSTTITLSGGNLTATVNSFAHGGVRSTTSQSSGKWYFEITMTTGVANNWLSGVANATLSLATGGGCGSDVNSICASPSGVSAWLINGVQCIGPTGSQSNGAVLGIAVDVTNQKIWGTTDGSKWNNSISNVPGTNGGCSFSALTGAVFPVFTDFRNSPADVAVLNTGGSAFTFSAPSGFTAWDGTPATAGDGLLFHGFP